MTSVFIRYFASCGNTQLVQELRHAKWCSNGVIVFLAVLFNLSVWFVLSLCSVCVKRWCKWSLHRWTQIQGAHPWSRWVHGFRAESVYSLYYSNHAWVFISLDAHSSPTPSPVYVLPSPTVMHASSLYSPAASSRSSTTSQRTVHSTTLEQSSSTTINDHVHHLKSSVSPRETQILSAISTTTDVTPNSSVSLRHSVVGTVAVSLVVCVILLLLCSLW